MHHQDLDSSKDKHKGRISRHQESKEHLSQEITSLFQKIVRDGARNSHQLPLQRMLDLCERQLARLTKGKVQNKQRLSPRAALTENELTISVVGIQTRVILDEQNHEEENGEDGQTSKRKSLADSREKIIIKRYENLVGEVDHNEAQIRKFMDSEVLTHKEIDFASSLEFFMNMAQRLKKLGGQKIIASRIRLLQVLTFFLREATKRLHPQKSQLTKAEENNSDGSFIYTVNIQNVSEQQIQQNILDGNLHQSLSYQQVNKYSRFASPFLDQKMVELSGVCEQVTQLEVFSRTLQFSQLEAGHRKAFMRVVDVLMGLHNRVAYLSRRKPQLMKELENAAQKMTFINERIEQFLVQIEKQGEKIVPLSFTGLCKKWKSQLTQHFTTLQSHLGIMSQVIISQDIYHTNNYRKFNNFINIVELFSKIMGGEQGALEQWGQLVSSMEQGSQIEGFSEDQCRILRILDECLAMERSRYSALREEKNEHTNRTNEQLQVQVNKLISDYEKVKQVNEQLMFQNQELAEKLGLQERLKDELLMQVDERDKIIRNLSAKKINLQKKLANQTQTNQQNRSVVESAITKDDDLKRLEHEAQKYLEKSLLLAEQLKVSEAERERLMEAAESDRTKYMRTYDSINRLRPEKDRLEIECEDLRHQIQSLRAENQRNSNRLNKTITDLNNQKSLLEMQLDSQTKNRERLFQRLQLSQQRLSQYSKLMMSHSDNKDDGSLQRLQRENQRLKRDGENNQNQLKSLQQQNSMLRDDINTLKFRLKQLQLSREDNSDKEQAYNELKIKFDKTITKNQNLNRNLEDLKSQQQELEQKLRQSNKKIKDFEARERQFESERKRLTNNIEEGDRRYQDMQRQIDQLRHWAQKQTRNARDVASKKDMEVFDKTSTIGSLELKIKMLEEQLANKARESQSVSKELVDTKMKQYESTIETHKLIELKLQEQNKSLKKDLDHKIEIEFKLNGQIERLAKEIDRMKSELDKYLRELTEKQMIIKMERQKLDEKQKQVRQLEVKQKIRKQHSTPNIEKPPIDADTPSQLDSNDYHEHLSRSNMRYDNYYNARQYDRLKKQYNDFKKHATAKIQKLQEALKNNSPSGQSEKSQLGNSRRRENQLLNKIATLESALRNLEVVNRQLKDHYENQMRRINSEKDNVNNRLSIEVENLKRQLQVVQKPSQLQREKQEKFNELKRSIESLLNEKSKLQQENASLLNQRNSLQNEKFNWSHEINNLKQQIRRQTITIQNLENQRGDDLQRKNDQLSIQIANISKQRDLIRSQYESMRQHLEEQTKRAINAEAQLLKLKSDWQNQKQQRGLQSQNSKYNVDYLLAKINALEEALAAVGDELTDSKAANHEYVSMVPAGSRLAQSRTVTVTSEVNDFHKRQEEWNKKEQLYIQELERMSRQIASLKDTLNRGKPVERLITTSLPENSRASSTKSTYKQVGALGNNRAMSHIRVDRFLQGKKRWQKIQFMQSLSRWNVPTVVCQQVQDLRLMFLGMSDSILTLNREIMQLERIMSSSPNMSNLLQYAFRILTYFSQIDPHSQQATRIRNELQKISRQNTGGYFFTVLEQYTVHLLQNNTIEQYKRQLRSKAQELMEIKLKLEEVINRQIEQEQIILNRAQTASSRIREPGHYTSASYSSFRTTTSPHNR